MFPRFDRRFFAGDETFTCVGSGALGGKALGLALARDTILSGSGSWALPGDQRRPASADRRLHRRVRRLHGAEPPRRTLRSRGPPTTGSPTPFNSQIYPAELVGDLRGLIEQVHTPLAIRSSSLLEDALAHPFAGVYATKMIPNNQHAADARFSRLVEAIKFVYASTFFASARSYRDSVDAPPGVGEDGGDHPGGRRPTPRRPLLPGDLRRGALVRLLSRGWFGPVRRRGESCLGPRQDHRGRWALLDLFSRTTGCTAALRVDQKACSTAPRHASGRSTWALRPRTTPCARPSTWCTPRLKTPARTRPSTSWPPPTTRHPTGCDRESEAPARCVLDFGLLLRAGILPVNECVKRLLAVFKEAVGQDVEIEFAFTRSRDPEIPSRLGFLQVRPMATPGSAVEVTVEDLTTAGRGACASATLSGQRARRHYPRRGVSEAGSLRRQAHAGYGRGTRGRSTTIWSRTVDATCSSGSADGEAPSRGWECRWSGGRSPAPA